MGLVTGTLTRNARPTSAALERRKMPPTSTEAFVLSSAKSAASCWI